ncbi:MAG: hypothetical protein II721_00180, partial [Bacilli bacterium]|nr:hypothetical protein [Bacilli bacterium]
MHIASVSVDLGLTNLSSADNDGVKKVNAVLGEESEYASLFVGNVDDSGLMNDDNTVLGDLYNLANGFQSDDVDDPYYNLYGYNLIGVTDVKAGNFYLGIN